MQSGGKDPGAAYRKYVEAGRSDPENPLTSALSGWVLGSESFLKKAIALAQSDDDQKRQRTSRRLKAVTAEQIIEELPPLEIDDVAAALRFAADAVADREIPLQPSA